MPESKYEWRKASSAQDAAAELDFSIVRDDVSFRAQRWLHLITGSGMSTLKRALFFAAVSWLPVAVWALSTGRALHGAEHDSLAAHFGLHVRCLVAIPMMILAEGIANKAIPEFLRGFVDTGIVTAESMREFRARIASVARLRDRTLPWVVIIGVVIALSTASAMLSHPESMTWGNPPNGLRDIPFGGWWFLLVIRPLFTVLVLAWLWRGCLLFVLLVKIARMPLSLVPSHPDRVGGLGFVERLAFVFSPVVFAISSAAAASFAHEVIYHGVDPMSIKALLVTSAVLVSVIFLIPFAPLCVVLGKLKRDAVLQYANLVAYHDRLVHMRWIEGRDIGEPEIMDVPELGPVADIHAVYDAVANIRGMLVSKVAIAAVAVPAVLPMAYVFAIKMPLSDILGKIVKTVI
ncbi:MAG: hypothetical protein LBV73_28320 [Paraburkholderia sp.]|jgi:hypothetical protein|nr:hypothetical protein [Paraburkholderia sp.]